MYDFLFSDANLPFMGSIAVLFAILVLEVFGSLIGYSIMDGVDADADADFDHNVDGDVGGFVGDVLHWLGVGRVPLLVLIAIFSGIFGIIGLTLNQISSQVLGFTFPMSMTVPVAIILTLPVLSKSSRFIAKWLPRDETNSVTIDALVGLTGTITDGNASATNVAFARVYDKHGVQHNVRVLSADTGEIPVRSSIRLESLGSDGVFHVTKI